VTTQAIYPTKPLAAGFGIVATGVLVAVATVVGLTFVRPVYLAFAFGGLIVLIPTLLVRDPKAYWLFLLVLSIPFDVSKHAASWLVAPPDLAREFGLPASGTLSIDFYLTDVVLFVMLLPWLARLCLRRDTFYFPKIGYVFLVYLAWAMITAMITAPSFYLSIFEWCRQGMYFLSFVYLVNNVVTRAQFRAIVLGLVAGFVIEAGTVITFFDLGVGTETQALSGLYSDSGTRSDSGPRSSYESWSGEESKVKRSAGTFTHPAEAAYYFEYILPILLGYLLTAQRPRNRLLSAALFGAGWVALYLTFSRSGLVAAFCASTLYFGFAAWSGLISRRVFERCAFVFVLAVALATPLAINSLAARPQSFYKRLELNETALATYWRQPILGAGLNNVSAVMEGAMKTVLTSKGRETQVTVVHNYYLIVLIEVGLIGFLLFFTFFVRAVMVGLRNFRKAEPAMKLLLVGIVTALSGVAIHNFGDPFGGHSVHAMLFLYTALIIAIGRQVQSQNILPSPVHRTGVAA
jgi:hypothetical protein